MRSIFFFSLSFLIASYTEVGACGGGGGPVKTSMASTLSKNRVHQTSVNSRSRHEVAINYVEENSVFQEKVEKAAFKYGVAAGVSSNVATKNSWKIIHEIIEAVQLVKKANTEGWSLEFTLSAVSKASKAFLMSQYPKAPVSEAIAITEIGAAFTTAYTYGFFFSPEARALSR